MAESGFRALTVDELNRISYPFKEGTGLYLMDWAPGYALKWTGWKWAQDSTILVAQWCAVQQAGHHGGTHYYASCPGGQGPYRIGEVFDLGGSGPRLYIEDLGNWVVGLARALSLQAETYKRLTEVVPGAGGLFQHHWEVKL